MPVRYHAGIDTVKLGGLSVVVGGVASGTATVASGTYCHISISSVTGGTTYRALYYGVDTALAVVDAGFSCSFDATTLAYTISHASNFTLTWTGTGGENLRKALGFSADLSGSNSYTSDVRPFYVIEAEIDGRSQYTDVYEPDDIAEDAVSDGGDAFGVSKDTTELWCDWLQSMETKEATLSRSATSAVPWTWEHFFKHCRNDQPFLVTGDSDSTGIVYKLRGDFASFGLNIRRPHTADYAELWDLQFYTRDLGALT